MTGGRSLSGQELGRPLPALQQGRPPSAGHPTSQATSRPPGKPDTGCSQPTSPSCQRAGRSELMALPVALPGSQVLQFPGSPQPQPHSPPVVSLLPVPFASSAGPGLNCPSGTPPGGNLIFVDLCAWLSALEREVPPCTPHPARAGMRLGRRRLPAQLPEGACGVGWPARSLRQVPGARGWPRAAPGAADGVVTGRDGRGLTP